MLAHSVQEFVVAAKNQFVVWPYPLSKPGLTQIHPSQVIGTDLGVGLAGICATKIDKGRIGSLLNYLKRTGL